jgi:hypothetical protein
MRPVTDVEYVKTIFHSAFICVLTLPRIIISGMKAKRLNSYPSFDELMDAGVYRNPVLFALQISISLIRR